MAMLAATQPFPVRDLPKPIFYRSYLQPCARLNEHETNRPDSSHTPVAHGDLCKSKPRRRSSIAHRAAKESSITIFEDVIVEEDVGFTCASPKRRSEDTSLAPQILGGTKLQPRQPQRPRKLHAVAHVSRCNANRFGENHDWNPPRRDPILHNVQLDANIRTETHGRGDLAKRACIQNDTAQADTRLGQLTDTLADRSVSPSPPDASAPPAAQHAPYPTSRPFTRDPVVLVAAENIGRTLQQYANPIHRRQSILTSFAPKRIPLKETAPKHNAIGIHVDVDGENGGKENIAPRVSSNAFCKNGGLKDREADVRRPALDIRAARRTSKLFEDIAASKTRRQASLQLAGGTRPKTPGPTTVRRESLVTFQTHHVSRLPRRSSIQVASTESCFSSVGEALPSHRSLPVTPRKLKRAEKEMHNVSAKLLEDIARPVKEVILSEGTQDDLLKHLHMTVQTSSSAIEDIFATSKAATKDGWKKPLASKQNMVRMYHRESAARASQLLQQLLAFNG